jgi:hypothetical protein
MSPNIFTNKISMPKMVQFRFRERIPLPGDFEPGAPTEEVGGNHLAVIQNQELQLGN